MDKYYYDKKSFVIEDYNRCKTFSSFLPGIAGITGMPAWAFYVNKGQGMAGFGTGDKDGAIMEFQPANKAYECVQYKGFRTFIKILDRREDIVYEPFVQSYQPGTMQKMYISLSCFEIEEITVKYGLKVNIVYSILPGENFSALIRKVTVKNLSDEFTNMEILDGLPFFNCFGMTDTFLKNMTYTASACNKVLNLEKGMPVYIRGAVKKGNSRQQHNKAGNFYLPFALEKEKTTVLNTIVDPEIIFKNTSLSIPYGFIEKSMSDLFSSNQIKYNRIFCGFSGKNTSLAEGESITIYSLAGHTKNVNALNKRINEITSSKYIESKLKESEDIIKSLTEPVYTETSSELFDTYCRQTFLDNTLRGGIPLVMGNNSIKNSKVYHIYSRKHGDLERDYNFFVLKPEYYSQGNANYRDLNQNRRCDVLFNPRVFDYNVLFFMNLIQLDGYNPLVINGSEFKLDNQAYKFISTFIKRGEFENFFDDNFTPGSLAAYIDKNNIELSVPLEEFVQKAVQHCEQISNASYADTHWHDDGYWIDHWTYNIDLMENFLSIYPDSLRMFLFEKKDYTYYDSPAVVLPRKEKYMLFEDGVVRQTGSVLQDKNKINLINSRKDYKNQVRTQYGSGAVYKTSLFSKLVCLAVNKVASLDPIGAGMEMEAGKPGWNDGLNALPQMFASSTSETCELNRLISFMIKSAESCSVKSILLPVEVSRFLFQVHRVLCKYRNQNSGDKKQNMEYWDCVETLKEEYRESIKKGVRGNETQACMDDIKTVLRDFQMKVEQGIQKAYEMGNGLLPTYLYFKAAKYEFLTDNKEKQLLKNGKPLVKVTEFKHSTLPLFLEGQVKLMKVQSSLHEAANLYKKVKKSPLFDRKLKMYRINELLENCPDTGNSSAYMPGRRLRTTVASPRTQASLPRRCARP